MLLDLEIDKHLEDFNNTQHTVEVNVKEPSWPAHYHVKDYFKKESSYFKHLEKEFQKREFINLYAQEAFDKIQSSTDSFFDNYFFTGKQNGWFVLILNKTPKSRKAKKNIQIAKNIIELYFDKFAMSYLNYLEMFGVKIIKEKMKTNIKSNKISEVKKHIRRSKKKLERRYKKTGLTENFGQDFVQMLNDNFINISEYTDEMNTIRDLILQFENWCQTYNG